MSRLDWNSPRWGGIRPLWPLGSLVDEILFPIVFVALVLVVSATSLGSLRLYRRLRQLRVTLETELSERRRAESALRTSEAFYHSLVESLPQCILRKDLDERFTFANRRFCELLGRDLEQILGKTDFDFFPTELAEAYREDDRGVIRTGSTLETTEEHVGPSGEIRYVHIIKSPLRDTSGSIVGTQCIFWDVTAEKRAEEALKKSRERYEVAVQGSKDGLWDWDLETNQVYFSPQWKAILGYEDSEISNEFSSWRDRMHPDDRERSMEVIRAYLEGRRAEYELEHRLRHRDGSYRWILARGAALRDSAGRPYRFAGSHTDITARKEAEEQLREQNERLEASALAERQALDALKLAQVRMVETEKLASLGQMVAGVAHEINNPLSFVGNNIAVLERDMLDLRDLIALYEEAEPLIAAERPELLDRINALRAEADLSYTVSNLQGVLDRSREGLKRIQQIVKDLRLFARIDEGERNEADLNTGIVSTATIIHGHASNKGVEVVLDLHPLPPVVCYPARVNQVVMNLLTNAIDACSRGDRVTVRTRDEGEQVRIEVADTGSGIDPAVRDHIFDPFFTTKPIGHGTGLGLSISYGIVHEHGGTIEVDSVMGEGTTFRVLLPLRCKPAKQEEAVGRREAL